MSSPCRSSLLEGERSSTDIRGRVMLRCLLSAPLRRGRDDPKPREPTAFRQIAWWVSAMGLTGFTGCHDSWLRGWPSSRRAVFAWRLRGRADAWPFWEASTRAAMRSTRSQLAAPSWNPAKRPPLSNATMGWKPYPSWCACPLRAFARRTSAFAAHRARPGPGRAGPWCMPPGAQPRRGAAPPRAAPASPPSEQRGPPSKRATTGLPPTGDRWFSRPGDTVNALVSQHRLPP